jgi:hypothetical protein
VAKIDQKELLDKLLEASAQIHTASTRGGSNWIITSTETSDAIQEVYRSHVANWRKEKIKRIYDC